MQIFGRLQLQIFPSCKHATARMAHRRQPSPRKGLVDHTVWRIQTAKSTSQARSWPQTPRANPFWRWTEGSIPPSTMLLLKFYCLQITMQIRTCVLQLGPSVVSKWFNCFPGGSTAMSAATENVCLLSSTSSHLCGSERRKLKRTLISHCRLQRVEIPIDTLVVQMQGT